MEAKSNMPIVITGIGTVSPYGAGLEAFRYGIASGRACIDISNYQVSRCSTIKGAYFRNFDPDSFDSSSGFGRLARGTQFSIMAADEAIKDSKVSVDSIGHENIGIVFSSSRIALEKTEIFYKQLLEKGPNYLAPLVFQESVNNAPASHICLRYGITGSSITIVNGATGSIQAIAMASEWLRMNRAAIVIVISGESLSHIAHEVHSHAHSHAPVKLHGINECCPFDKRRNGFIFGEGAVAFIMESRAHAENRGASVKADILGYGITHEAYQVAKYHQEGLSIEKAMSQALLMAEVESSDIDWILGSANSTVDGDLAEAQAIRRLFKGSGPPISAIKSMIGEMECASGLFNTLAAITGIEDNLLYPTVNCQYLDEKCDLEHIFTTQKKQSNLVVVNSNWYGGGSSSVIISKPYF